MGTGTLTFIIFVFVLAQVALLMGIGIFRRKRKYRDLESLTSEPQITHTEKEFATQEPAWGGFRKFLVR